VIAAKSGNRDMSRRSGGPTTARTRLSIWKDTQRSSGRATVAWMRGNQEDVQRLGDQSPWPPGNTTIVGVTLRTSRPSFPSLILAWDPRDGLARFFVRLVLASEPQLLRRPIVTVPTTRYRVLLYTHVISGPSRRKERMVCTRSQIPKRHLDADFASRYCTVYNICPCPSRCLCETTANSHQ
jgi:hypothetical protein